jgi:putative ABC transport system substrate-binding protein
VLPAASRAQERVRRIGFLSNRASDAEPHLIPAFRQGLKEAGFVEGENVAIDYRWVAGRYDRLAAMVTDLVRNDVAVIVAGGIPATRASKAATSKVPIVFLIAGDPVEMGFAASLNRPGNNLTGVTSLGELTAKRLEVLRTLVPTAKTTALLVNPGNAALAESQVRGIEEVAKALGLQLHILHAQTDGQIEEAFAKLRTMPADLLVIVPDGFLLGRGRLLGEMAAHHALPAIFQNQDFAAAGGLISYGADSGDLFRQLGVQTGRVLKGAKPAELPVWQATKVEMTINLKAAKALGLDVPLTLLGRADHVIE